LSVSDVDMAIDLYLGNTKIQRTRFKPIPKTGTPFYQWLTYYLRMVPAIPLLRVDDSGDCVPDVGWSIILRKANISLLANEAKDPFIQK